jgi:hypothetical protein
MLFEVDALIHVGRYFVGKSLEVVNILLLQLYIGKRPLNYLDGCIEDRGIALILA